MGHPASQAMRIEERHTLARPLDMGQCDNSFELDALRDILNALPMAFAKSTIPHAALLLHP